MANIKIYKDHQVLSVEAFGNPVWRVLFNQRPGFNVAASAHETLSVCQKQRQCKVHLAHRQYPRSFDDNFDN
jgi:hypothetical protein